MEKDNKNYPQDTVDATPRDTSRRESLPSTTTEEEGRDGRQASCPKGGFERFDKFEKFEKVESPEGGRAGTSDPSNSSNSSNPTAELEERVRRDCRRECRRNLFVELLKTVAKVAGVILAAMGLSSFSEED